MQKAELIYGTIRKAIICLEMQPGLVISEGALCDRYGVSRTPVREALQRLAEEGLVNIYPHSGTYVSRLSFSDAEEGFVIRRALEIETVRRAALRVADADMEMLKRHIVSMRAVVESGRHGEYLDVDDAFHEAIASISQYPRIWKIIGLAKAHLDRMRQLSTPAPGHLATVTDQHEAILRAIESRSADQAELAMRIHLDSSFEVMCGVYRDSVAVLDDEDDQHG